MLLVARFANVPTFDLSAISDERSRGYWAYRAISIFVALFSVGALTLIIYRWDAAVRQPIVEWYLVPLLVVVGTAASLKATLGLRKPARTLAVNASGFAISWLPVLGRPTTWSVSWGTYRRAVVIADDAFDPGRVYHLQGPNRWLNAILTPEAYHGLVQAARDHDWKISRTEDNLGPSRTLVPVTILAKQTSFSEWSKEPG